MNLTTHLPVVKICEKCPCACRYFICKCFVKLTYNKIPNIHIFVMIICSVVYFSVVCTPFSGVATTSQTSKIGHFCENS